MAQLSTSDYALEELQAVLGLAQRSTVALGLDESAFPPLVREVRPLTSASRARGHPSPHGGSCRFVAVKARGERTLQHLDRLVRAAGAR